jgi:hypothetical protein
MLRKSLLPVTLFPLLSLACVEPSEPGPRVPTPPPNASTAEPAPASPSAMPAQEEAVTMGAPAAHCPAEEGQAPGPPEPFRPAPPSAASTIDVKSSAKGISLDVDGDRAGAVLARIALVSKHGIEVHDADAAVPVYAHVRDMAWDALVRSIAQAAGLDVMEQPGDTNGKLTVMDARTRRDAERRARAAQLDATPLETHIIPAKHAEAMAHVIAMTLLSCRGLVTAAPQRMAVVVRDLPAVLDRVSQLARSLDAAPPAAVSIDMDPVRMVEVLPGARAPLCARARSGPLPVGRSDLVAEGGAAGELLMHVAAAQGKDVIVGCGGDSPAYYAPVTASPQVADVAAAVGLVSFGGNVYGSGELAAARAAVAPAAPAKHLLRTFGAPFAHELAAAINEMLGRSSAAVAYEPAQMLVVLGNDAEMANVDADVKGWSGR